jgi:hypothetical protein
MKTANVDLRDASVLAERLRHHVISRNGPAKDDDGEVILPNGAWRMMLDAADMIDGLSRVHDKSAQNFADLVEALGWTDKTCSESEVRAEVLRRLHAAAADASEKRGVT